MLGKALSHRLVALLCKNAMYCKLFGRSAVVSNKKQKSNNQESSFENEIVRLVGAITPLVQEIMMRPPFPFAFVVLPLFSVPVFGESAHEIISSNGAARARAEKLANTRSVWPQPSEMDCGGPPSAHEELVFHQPAAFVHLPPPLEEVILTNIRPNMFRHHYHVRPGLGAPSLPQLRKPGPPSVKIIYDVTDPQATVDFGIDESYTLTIEEPPPSKNTTESSHSVTDDHDQNVVLLVHVVSPTQVGAIYATESLAQLINFLPHAAYSLPKRCTIRDRPRFPHRGLLIDTGRHWLAPTLLFDHVLPSMRMNKLNVLHWHLTDDQAWPVDSEEFPELSEKGAFSSMEVYSKNMLRAVVKTASAQGIRVVPEFDMPGHCSTVRLSHPELFPCTKDQSPRGAYDPTKNATYSFLGKLLAEFSLGGGAVGEGGQFMGRLGRSPLKEGRLGRSPNV